MRRPLGFSALWSILNAQRSRQDVPFKNLGPSGAHTVAKRQRAGLTYLAVYRASPLERISMIKHGIRATEAKRIIADLSIGQGAALKALKLSPATVNKKAKQNETLSPGESERVIGFAKLVGQLEAMIQESGLPKDLTPSFGCPAGSKIPSRLLAARGQSISWIRWRARPSWPRRSRSFRAGRTLEPDGLAHRD